MDCVDFVEFNSEKTQMNEIHLIFRSSNSQSEFIYSAIFYRRQFALLSTRTESQCVYTDGFNTVMQVSQVVDLF